MANKVEEERQKLLRAIDANSNRVSEGLRVVEEVVRFVLDDSDLTKKLKGARHFVREKAQDLGGSLCNLVAARESDADVGRGLSTTDSSERKDAAGIVAANMKRAQEGVRVLEELSASFDAGSSNKFKELRFELYSLEKNIIGRL
ncbi:MAG: thiamine-phosphate pyrophosphorylase [Candidatus Eisenbacteria bacterium]|nr:thiamine-phosphate pyrophosphorylase [Candidatus Eisenbacteria bacterium]